MCQVVFIFAISKNGVMGCDGDLPWNYPEDLQRFKDRTMGHPIVMGRKTWESLPVQPLPGRKNIVLTKNSEYTDDRCVVYNDLKPVIYDHPNDTIYVIGGSQIFQEYLAFADKLDICYIDKEYEGDIKWKGINLNEWFMFSDTKGETPELTFMTYVRKSLDRPY